MKFKISIFHNSTTSTFGVGARDSHTHMYQETRARKFTSVLLHQQIKEQQTNLLPVRKSVIYRQLVLPREYHTAVKMNSTDWQKCTFVTLGRTAKWWEWLLVVFVILYFFHKKRATIWQKLNMYFSLKNGYLGGMPGWHS